MPTTSEAPIRTGTVNAYLAELHTELLELESTAGVLAQHLEPISRAMGDGGKLEPRPPSSCMVVGSISNAIERVVALRERLNAMTTCLEIQ